MRLAGLEGRAKKPWRKTTVADPAFEKAKDLVQREFGSCEELDARYVGDITCISTWEGWRTWPPSSTSPPAEWWAGRSLITCAPSWSPSRSRWRSRHAGPGRGQSSIPTVVAQYTSTDYHQLARDHGMVLSVGMAGECWDNAVAELFFATIKRELINTRAWPTRPWASGSRRRCSRSARPPAGDIDFERAVAAA